jgi:hypothetical protein
MGSDQAPPRSSTRSCLLFQRSSAVDSPPARLSQNCAAAAPASRTGRIVAVEEPADPLEVGKLRVDVDVAGPGPGLQRVADALGVDCHREFVGT